MAAAEMQMNLEHLGALLCSGGADLAGRGRVVTCGWNSGGIGGPTMRIERIMLVAHGGWHNGTIVTVERKVVDPLELF